MLSIYNCYGPIWHSSSSELSQIWSLYAKMKNMSRIRKQVGQTTLYQQLQILRFLELGIPSSKNLRPTNFLDLDLCKTDLYIWEKPQVISLIRITTMAEVIRKIHVTVGKQHNVFMNGKSDNWELMHGWVSTTIREICS